MELNFSKFFNNLEQELDQQATAHQYFPKTFTKSGRLNINIDFQLPMTSASIQKGTHLVYFPHASFIAGGWSSGSPAVLLLVLQLVEELELLVVELALVLVALLRAIATRNVGLHTLIAVLSRSGCLLRLGAIRVESDLRAKVVLSVLVGGSGWSGGAPFTCVGLPCVLRYTLLLLCRILLA